MDLTLDLVQRLSDANVSFVVVGGMAGSVHGASQVTEDLDICASLDESNLERIIKALQPVDPRWRMLPDRPKLANDASALAGYKNLYLETSEGQIDILTEVTGIGGVDDVLAVSIEADFLGRRIRVLSLDALIEAKRKMNREKDRSAVRELEDIRARLTRE